MVKVSKDYDELFALDILVNYHLKEKVFVQDQRNVMAQDRSNVIE